MPGRSYTAGSGYRYGYQGSEIDRDLGENSYSTYFRELDVRIGRWWSSDPKRNEFSSPYVAMDNNPIWFNDILGDIVDPKRKKGMNFFVVARKDLRDEDIKAHGGKLNSPYWADYKRAKRMERRGKGKMIVIEADDPNEALQQIKDKLGEDGYVKNIVFDYHRTERSFGCVSIESKEASVVFKELTNGYAGVETTVYLGQCWAGGNDVQKNLTEDISKQLDGATVYGHKAEASSFSFYFFGHFSRYTGMKEGDYRNYDEYKNVGKHVVSFYNPLLKKVVSVEILDKVKILNNGEIHSKFSRQDLQSLKVIIPSPGAGIPVPPRLVREEDVVGPPPDH